jgi:DNA-binding response OmpR family regulator
MREATVNNTVLIVDDNTTLAYFSARNLRSDIEELEVFTASSCAEAREVANRHHPSVVIVDLGLEDGNGLDLMREMKKDSPGLATVLISGEEPPPSSLNGLFGFLVKPYEAEDLVDLVRRALRAERPEPIARPGQEREIECRGYDFHHAQNRLAGLLAGLRAFGADLRAQADDAPAVRETVDEYIDRLCGVVVEVSEMLPRCPANKVRKGRAE